MRRDFIVAMSSAVGMTTAYMLPINSRQIVASVDRIVDQKERNGESQEKMKEMVDKFLALREPLYICFHIFPL